MGLEAESAHAGFRRVAGRIGEADHLEPCAAQGLQAVEDARVQLEVLAASAREGSMPPSTTVIGRSPLVENPRCGNA